MAACGVSDEGRLSSDTSGGGCQRQEDADQVRASRRILREGRLLTPLFSCSNDTIPYLSASCK